MSLRPDLQAALNECIALNATTGAPVDEESACTPHVLDRYNVTDVIASYAKLYAEGRHGVAPDFSSYEWMTSRGPDWVLAEIPLDMLDYQREDESSEERVALAHAYANRVGTLPAGSASYGGFRQKRRSGKAYVQDGNHRTLAAQFRGDCTMRVFMPSNEYAVLVEDARWRGLTS